MGRYYITLTTDALFDPSGPTPGYVMWDGTRPTAVQEPAPGGPNNAVKEARGFYTVEVRRRQLLRRALRVRTK